MKMSDISLHKIHVVPVVKTTINIFLLLKQRIRVQAELSCFFVILNTLYYIKYKKANEQNHLFFFSVLLSAI